MFDSSSMVLESAVGILDSTDLSGMSTVRISLPCPIRERESCSISLYHLVFQSHHAVHGACPPWFSWGSCLVFRCLCRETGTPTVLAAGSPFRNDRRQSLLLGMPFAESQISNAGQWFSLALLAVLDFHLASTLPYPK